MALPAEGLFIGPKECHSFRVGCAFVRRTEVHFTETMFSAVATPGVPNRPPVLRAQP